MSDASEQARLEHFRTHWMTWIVLHQFLPARLCRELASVVVESASGGETQLADLFEERLSGEDPISDLWLARALPCNERSKSYLQQFVRNLIWRNDSTGGAFRSDVRADPSNYAVLIENIAILATADLTVPAFLTDQFTSDAEVLQVSFRKFVDAFKAASQAGSESEFSAACDLIAALEMPLAALATKHLADLCVDIDAWDRANAGYGKAHDLLVGWQSPPAWAECASWWKAIVVQSQAAATAVIVGPGPGAEALNALRAERDPVTEMWLMANTGLDLFATAGHPDVKGMEADDTRVAIMRAPLMQDTVTDTQAVHYSLNGKYQEAHRHFWAALRRQTALGATTRALGTRVRYAKSILTKLLSRAETDKQPLEFEIASRLLVEGADADAAATIEWSDTLVDAYVEPKVVDMVREHARRYLGRRREREQVAIELFRQWIVRIAPAKVDLSVAMWRHIAMLANEFPSRFEGHLDVGRRSLGALTDLARKRPELRHHVARDVADALLTRLRTDRKWWGTAPALETASEYSDVFDADQLTTIVELTLTILAGINPDQEIWPVVRPALALLVSDTVKKAANANAELGKTIVDQIIRFGLEQESEHTRLFFYLRNFDEALFSDPKVVALLQAPLVDVRQQTKETGSSRVTESICALLLLPGVAGADGVADAFEGLARVLATASTERYSPGLPYAYDCFLITADNLAQIRLAVGSDDKVQASIERLLTLVVNVWRIACERPLVFAPFALPPPTKPDPIVVHNWAYCSLRLAEAGGQLEKVSEVLTEATRQPELKAPIALARASRSVGKLDDHGDADAVLRDDRDAFYLALGSRLVQLEKSTGDDAKRFCDALVRQSLRFGPRELDAPVLLAAARLGLHDRVRSYGLKDYLVRLQNRRDVRVALRPIADLFSPGSPASQ